MERLFLGHNLHLCHCVFSRSKFMKKCIHFRGASANLPKFASIGGFRALAC
jgi:hypothetical protein